jgi:hypothetical protein
MVKVTFVVYFSLTSINISQQDQLCMQFAYLANKVMTRVTNNNTN